jgi:hypothetical protein
MCIAIGYVRFAPESDRESGFPHKVMSAVSAQCTHRLALPRLSNVPVYRNTPAAAPEGVMKVHELVASFGRAGESANPMAAAHEILESLREQVEAIENSLSYISGTGGNAGQVFYRSPQITLLKVCFPVGRRTPPHNHGTWATILQLSGEEKNTLYRRENGKLRKVGEMTLGSLRHELGNFRTPSTMRRSSPSEPCCMTSRSMKALPGRAASKWKALI